MKRYILLLVTILTTVGCIYANDTLQREVTIVRNFTPVVRPTEKINTLPPVTTPHFGTAPVSYAFDAYSTEVNSKSSKVAIPYVDSNEELMKRYNGYATFDMGMYMSMAANVAVSGHLLASGPDTPPASSRFRRCAHPG